MMRRKLVFHIAACCLIFVFLLLSISGEVFGQAEKDKKIIKRTTNEISGEIASIGKDFIAIIYKRDESKGVEYEMLLPIDTSIKLEHKRNLTELSIGDTVEIQFEDVVLEDVRGEKKMGRKAKVIRFVRPAVKKPEPLKLPEPGEGLPDD